MGKIEAIYKEKSLPFPRQLLQINGEYRRLKSVAKSVAAS